MAHTQATPFPSLATWPSTREEAKTLQETLRHKILPQDHFSALQTVAGVDVGYDTKQDTCYAVIVLMSLEGLQPITSVTATLPATFPYIPGFLSFREIPVILKALAELPQLPDLWVVDGQGIAHPRRLGIAAHLGVLLDMPTIGVAKSRLIGHYTLPGPHKGDYTLLMDKQERIGTVLRSKNNTHPLFISPGHRVSHDTALQLTLQCLTRYRLPEPTRMADKLSKTRNRSATGAS